MNTTTISHIQISAGALLILLSMIPAPTRPTVAQLRRRARCRGLKSFRRGDQRLPLKYARRAELEGLLEAFNG